MRNALYELESGINETGEAQLDRDSLQERLETLESGLNVLRDALSREMRHVQPKHYLQS